LLSSQQTPKQQRRIHEPLTCGFFFCPAQFYCVAISPDSAHVACASESGVIDVMDVSSCAVAQSFIGHTNSVCTPSFLTFFCPQNHHFCVFTSKQIFNMIWSEDCTLLLSASKDSTARLWDFKSGTCIRVFPHDDVVCIPFPLLFHFNDSVN